MSPSQMKHCQVLLILALISSTSSALPLEQTPPRHQPIDVPPGRSLLVSTRVCNLTSTNSFRYAVSYNDGDPDDQIVHTDNSLSYYEAENTGYAITGWRRSGSRCMEVAARIFNLPHLRHRSMTVEFVLMENYYTRSSRTSRFYINLLSEEELSPTPITTLEEEVSPTLINTLEEEVSPTLITALEDEVSPTLEKEASPTLEEVSPTPITTLESSTVAETTHNMDETTTSWSLTLPTVSPIAVVFSPPTDTPSSVTDIVSATLPRGATVAVAVSAAVAVGSFVCAATMVMAIILTRSRRDKKPADAEAAGSTSTNMPTAEWGLRLCSHRDNQISYQSYLLNCSSSLLVYYMDHHNPYPLLACQFI